MGARAQTGQATVEAVALWLLIAGLLALVGAWLVAHTRPAAGPPPVVERVARPLLEPDRSGGLPWEALVPRGTGGPVAWRVLGGARRIGRAGYELRVEAELAFADGFLDRLQQRAEGVAADPVGQALDLAVSLEDPAGAGRSEGSEAGPALTRYLDEIAHSSPREGMLRVARDLGRLAADEALRRLVRAAGRGATRRRGDRDRPGPGERAGAAGTMQRLIDALRGRRAGGP